MLFFTSITSCFLPKARVLGKTLKKHNPSAKLWVLLSDELPEEFELEKEPFDGILDSREIELNCDMSVPFWFFLHDVTETCTAVKAWGALRLLEITGEDKIVYLDPDTAVFNSLLPLEKMLDEYDIIITPHRLAPEPRFDSFYYGDHQLYTHGVFNLGFVAVKKSEQGVAFLEWWCKMSENFCFIETSKGLFTDQKLIDLAPAFFDKLHICRDEGYNISWWNITQRTISGTPDALFVNSNPVYFYHFSHFDSGLHKQIMKEYCNDNQDLWSLYEWYVQLQNACGYEKMRYFPWRYSTYDNGEPIANLARKTSRENSSIFQKYRYSDPYSSRDSNGLYQFFKSNFPECLDGYEAPHVSEETSYFEAYHEVLNSRSFRLGKKIVDFAGWFLPAGSIQRRFLAKVWRRLRGKTETHS